MIQIKQVKDKGTLKAKGKPSEIATEASMIVAKLYRTLGTAPAIQAAFKALLTDPESIIYDPNGGKIPGGDHGRE